MNIARTTEFSPCRKYRYTLWRDWSDQMGLLRVGYPNRFVQFIGLNPSTADEVQDDPTIRRCIGFAKAQHVGAMCMTNLFAFRATDPAVMKAQVNPISDMPCTNTEWILKVAREASLVVCAWGVHGSHQCRSGHIVGTLRHQGIKVYHLGLTASGEPKHPLYLSKTTQPQEWT